MVTMPDTWTSTRVTTNHVLDPSFEGTPPLTGWSSTKLFYDKTNVLQSFDQYGTGARLGSKSLRMVCGTSGTTVSNWVSIDNVFTTDTIVIYVKTTAASPKQVGIVIKPIQADGTVVPAAVMSGAYGYSNNIGTTWTKVTVTKPSWTTALYPTMTGLRMYLTAGGPYAGINAGDEILWDTFADNGTVDYFDGDFSDAEFAYAWTGTPHASASTKTDTRQLHYPSVITLGTPFQLSGAGFSPGSDIEVFEGTWEEIIETTTADGSGAWTIEMTIPPNTDPEVGPVAGDGWLRIWGSVGSVLYSPDLIYVDPPAATVNAQVFVGGTAKAVTEMRVSTGGTLIPITEAGA